MNLTSPQSKYQARTKVEYLMTFVKKKKEKKGYLMTGYQSESK